MPPQGAFRHGCQLDQFRNPDLRCIIFIQITDDPGNIQRFDGGKKAVFKIHILSEKQKNLQGIQPVRVTLTAPDGRKTEVFTSAENGTALFTYLPGRNEPAGKWKLEAEELASGIKTIHEWTK